MAYPTSPSSLPGMGSSQSRCNVLTYCIPTAAIVARDAALTDMVSAKIRVSPTSSNPYRMSSRAPSLPELSLTCYRTLVGTLGWFEDPPPDELSVDESGPEAEPRHAIGDGESPAMQLLDLVT